MDLMGDSIMLIRREDLTRLFDMNHNRISFKITSRDCPTNVIDFNVDGYILVHHNTDEIPVIGEWIFDYNEMQRIYDMLHEFDYNEMISITLTDSSIVIEIEAEGLSHYKSEFRASVTWKDRV